MNKLTLSQEYQNLLYGLFKKDLFNLEGKVLKNDEGLMEDYIPKSDFIDASIGILNEFGKLMSEDERLNNATESS